MAAFTLIFGICIFYRLGSLHTPETFETIKVGEVGENEIVLQFDGEQPISGISVYLGYKGKREISFSVYDRSTDTWEIVKSRYSVESAFCWNNVEIDRTVSSLGMVLMEDKAQIMEIVCLDDAGEPVLPANAADYPQLLMNRNCLSGNRLIMMKPCLMKYTTAGRLMNSCTGFPSMKTRTRLWEKHYFHRNCPVWHESLRLAFYVCPVWNTVNPAYVPVCPENILQDGHRLSFSGTFRDSIYEYDIVSDCHH